jgi:hypothetical protein
LNFFSTPPPLLTYSPDTGGNDVQPVPTLSDEETVELTQLALHLMPADASAVQRRALTELLGAGMFDVNDPSHRLLLAEALVGVGMARGWAAGDGMGGPLALWREHTNFPDSVCPSRPSRTRSCCSSMRCCCRP